MQKLSWNVPKFHKTNYSIQPKAKIFRNMITEILSKKFLPFMSNRKIIYIHVLYLLIVTDERWINSKDFLGSSCKEQESCPEQPTRNLVFVFGVHCLGIWSGVNLIESGSLDSAPRPRADSLYVHILVQDWYRIHWVGLSRSNFVVAEDTNIIRKWKK